MDMDEDKITRSMREQLKRGYLKLAILYTLLKGPAHGYEMLKRIKENTLGLISPTAGSLYPALRDLEEKGFIEGEWCGGRRRMRVYRITERGKETFKEVVKGHFSLASAIRKWLLEQLAPIHSIEGLDLSSGIIPRAIKMLLLDGEVSERDKIEFLKEFREYLKKASGIISNLIANVESRLMELETKAANKTTTQAAEGK
ncbi:PadR family transcriptional regulator [Candidatus Bathyarchaeota archaeon]|nr:PadR family transcriptional regulator [Candidatus Bathyarchaeota archaeon]